MPSKEVEEALENAASQERADTRATIQRLEKSLAREKNRTDTLVEVVRTAVKDGLASLELPPVKPYKADRRTKGDEMAIIHWSDWQLGKATPTYSSDVCEERIQRYCDRADSIINVQRQAHPVSKAVLFLLGDMIEGELIFPGQAHEVDSSLYRQITIDGPRILGQGIRWAASRFKEVEVYAVPGNHGAIGGRARRDSHPETNGDRMLYQIVSQLTADLENVTWHIAEDWWEVADLGEHNKWLLCHGDQVRGWAGIPWYGWVRKVLGWASLNTIWSEFDFNYVGAGHFHTPTRMYINGRSVWINASTESHNPYALEQLAAAGEPAQWLLFARPDKGVTSEWLVHLS
jgi:hypothetical protein